MLNFTGEQIAAFKTIVLEHITHQLPPEEWVWLRSRASEQIAGVMPKPEADLDATPQQLVDENVFDDTLRLGDVLKAYADRSPAAQGIGQIEGKPVYFIPSTGIYLWGPGPESNTLSFWISYPSYPPGW